MLWSNSQQFSVINLESKPIQYNNKPIEAIFSTNLTNPIITVNFNGLDIAEVSNGTSGYTKQFIDGKFYIKYIALGEGLFKVVASEGTVTDVATIQVKTPYIDSKNDIPPSVDKGTTSTFKIQTFNPQGDPVDADSVSIDVTGPDNQKKTIFLERSGSFFLGTYTYALPGNYIFKIQARKNGYETTERTAITSSLKEGRIHPILFWWIGAIILLIILIIIRVVRKRSLFRR